jgi:ABC-type transport system substrate-binding protein
VAIKKGLFASIFIITLIAACSDSPEPVKVTSVFEQAGTPVNIETTTESTDQPTSQPTLTPVIKIIDDHFEPTATPDPRTAFTGYLTDDIPTIDPQIAEDNVSFNYIENLFVQLTNYDPNTSEIVPEAAASWEISQDGRLYTFHLPTDMPWVYHNPVTEETTQEADKEGNPRFVTAQDFVYGILLQTCSISRTASCHIGRKR